MKPQPTSAAAPPMPYESVIKIGMILLIVLIALVFLKSVFKAASLTQEARDDSREIKKDDLTYSKSVYNGFAKRLLSAFKGWGTTESEVVDVINALKTRSDWYALKNAFGYNVKIPHVFGSNTGDLTQHLTYELEDNEDAFNKVKEHLRSIGVNEF